MIIAELKVLLEKYPSDMRVVVAGYEGGYNDISIVERRSIQRDVNRQDYMGQHDEADDKKAGEPALLLAGKNELADE